MIEQSPILPFSLSPLHLPHNQRLDPQLAVGSWQSENSFQLSAISCQLSVFSHSFGHRSLGVGGSHSPLLPIPPSSSSRPTPLLRLRSTFDIINAARSNSLPDKIMLTVHPQRWTNKPLPWLKELVWQNIKNAGKWVVVRSRRRSDL